MLHYQNPFKIYLGMSAESSMDGWTEAAADTYKILRGCLLGKAWFFSGGTVTETVQTSHIRTVLHSNTYTFRPGHTSSPDSGTDKAPIFIDIENEGGMVWEPYSPHVANDAEALEVINRMSEIIDLVREAFPNRLIGQYGWSCDPDWYAIKNWVNVQGDPEDELYASRLSWFQRWKRENERVKRGGTINARTTRGGLHGCSMSNPVCFLPNDTSYSSGTAWQDHADTRLWTTYTRFITAETKRLYSRPCIPWIQFYKPVTTTYLNDDWLTHQLDVLYSDPNCDGVVIYQPTGSPATWAEWRDVVQAWATANLGA